MYCMKNNNDLLFPFLTKFYKFLYNFSIYCHCYTHNGVSNHNNGRDDTKRKKEWELFYMKEYHSSK